MKERTTPLSSFFSGKFLILAVIFVVSTTGTSFLTHFPASFGQTMNSAPNSNSVYLVATSTTTPSGFLQNDDATLVLGQPIIRANGTIMPQGEPRNGTQLAAYNLDCKISNIANNNVNTSSTGGSSSSIGCKDTGSFSIKLRDNRTQYGEGRGALITDKGEIITYTFQFVGSTDNEGRSIYHGSWFPTTSSARLHALNNTMALFEVRVEHNGKSTLLGWLWK